MLKILICCGNGMGTSSMMANHVENIMKNLNITDYSENHDSVGNAESIVPYYDVVICSTFFEHIFEPICRRENKYLITLQNVFGPQEIEKKLTDYINNVYKK